jgi:hypothetical protein
MSVRLSLFVTQCQRLNSQTYFINNMYGKFFY